MEQSIVCNPGASVNNHESSTTFGSDQEPLWQTNQNKSGPNGGINQHSIVPDDKLKPVLKTGTSARTVASGTRF